MVSKRRDSLKKLDQELKVLSKKLPPTDQFFDALINLAHDKPAPAMADRTSAIVATQFVEHALAIAIKSHLKTPLDGSEEKDVFDGPGAPLGSFSSKIVLAFALGIVDREKREDLDSMRNIRNAFAHSMTHMNFNDEPVAALCMALRGPKLMGTTGIADVLGFKGLFVQAAGQLYFSLITYLPEYELKALQGPWPP